MCEDARACAHARCVRNAQAPEQSESYIRRCETGHVAFRIFRKFEIGHFAFRTFRRCETGHFAVSQGAKPDTPQFRTRTLRRQTLSESVWRRPRCARPTYRYHNDTSVATGGGRASPRSLAAPCIFHSFTHKPPYIGTFDNLGTACMTQDYTHGGPT